MSFTVKIKASKLDYIKFTQFAVNKQLPQKNKPNYLKILINLVVWCVLTVAFLTIFQVGKINFSEFHRQTAIIVALPFAIFIITYLVYFYNLKKALLPNENGLFMSEKIMHLDENGVTCSGEGYNTHYHWSVIKDCVENNGDVYIHK